MVKVFKYIVIFVIVSIFILEIVYRLVFRAQTGFVVRRLLLIDYKIFASRQVDIMKKEAELREQNPPTEEQISLMKQNYKLCYQNTDCNDAPKLQSCFNGPWNNKYYECNNQFDRGCLSIDVGCMQPAGYYGVCVDNRCESRSIFSPVKKILNSLKIRWY